MAMPGLFQVKTAFHFADTKYPPVASPEVLDREVYDHETESIRNIIAEKMPSLNGRLLSTATCMYTTTPDEHL